MRERNLKQSTPRRRSIVCCTFSKKRIVQKRRRMRNENREAEAIKLCALCRPRARARSYVGLQIKLRHNDSSGTTQAVETCRRECFALFCVLPGIYSYCLGNSSFRCRSRNLKFASTPTRAFLPKEKTNSQYAVVAFAMK